MSKHPKLVSVQVRNGNIQKALKIFNLVEKDIEFDSIKNNEFLSKGNKIEKIDILFKKIEKKND